MACFDSQGSDSFTLRGDVQLKGESFRGLFGWPGASLSLQRGLSSLENEQRARPAAEPPRRQPVQVAARRIVAVQRPQKLGWQALKTKLQRDGQLNFRRARGKLVAPVLDVVKDRLHSIRQPGRARTNYSLKRKVDDALGRHLQWRLGVHVFKDRPRDKLVC